MIPTNIFQIMAGINPRLQNQQNVNTPDEMAQYLLNNGLVNQQQVNQARQMWNQPNIRQMIQSKFGY